MMNKTWLLLYLLLWASQLAGQVRIALCPLDSASRSLADLALVELSAEQDIVCLERAEIDRLLAESRLLEQTDGDFRPNPRVMQNAELLIVLHDGELQAFDAVTGVRLANHELDTAPEAGRAIRQALAKRERFANKRLRKLSLMPMTPVNLSPEQEGTARKLERILSRLLGNRSDLVLLERRHLLVLLNEPGAEHNDLTSQLFAGALLLKPAVLQEGLNGLCLRLQYFTPDGRTVLHEDSSLFPHDSELDRHLQEFLERQPPPEIAPEDKPGEARAFILEAWFALSHALPQDALSSAASAAALDPAYEKQLCRILAQVAGEHYWNNIGKEQLAAGHAGAISNLQRAARLAAKHHFFPNELGDAMGRYGPIVTGAILSLLPLEVQQQWCDTIELILTTRRETLAGHLRLADLPGSAWTDRFFSLQARAQYIHSMTTLCHELWDYSYWQRFVEPELEKYIRESNELLPEMVRFQSLSPAEKELHCRQTWEQERFRAMTTGLVPSLDHSHWELVPFTIIRNKTLHPIAANLAIHRRALEKLTCSRTLNLALQAHAGLARLNMTTAPTERGFNYIKELTEEEKHVLADFFDQAAELLETAVSIGPPHFTPLSYGLRLDHPDCLPQRLRLLGLAIRHHACYTPWDQELIAHYHAWPRETAVKVHQQLYAYLDQYEHGPRTASHSDAQRLRVRDLYRLMLARLEQHFEIPPSRTLSNQVVDPFARVFRLELPDGFGFTRSPCLLGFDGRSIFLDSAVKDEIIQLQIDTAADMAIVNQRRLPHNAPRNSRGPSVGPGIILTDYFVSRHGGCIFLYAKDKPSCQLLDFSRFSRQRCRAMAGHGDRLFLSFGWDDDEPTTVLEYNVRRGTTKVIVSSMDRSIPWPWQGAPLPIPIPHLHCDGPGRRLIMLPTPMPSAGTGHSMVGLQFLAFHWETGQWENASRPLPLPAGHQQTFLDQTGLWLLHDAGFGKINDQGYWQTVFRKQNGRLVPGPQPGLVQTSRNDNIDDSGCLVPTKEHRDISPLDMNFNLYADELLFSRNMIMLVPEQKFIRLAKPFAALGCFNGRYVVGHYTGSAEGPGLVIGVLKERQLLAQ
ncbi:MAG: hypothetical protein PHT80_01715 [Lentisphaeria bacterium]|nr:hypothetical protein [Lentisphaeria bacterium]